jgi:hypothetical protein
MMKRSSYRNARLNGDLPDTYNPGGVSRTRRAAFKSNRSAGMTGRRGGEVIRQQLGLSDSTLTAGESYGGEA